MIRPEYLQGRRWDLATARRSGLIKTRTTAREMHARALSTGDVSDAIRRAPAALAARYALPLDLDYRGLYCPQTGRLLIELDTDRGGRDEAIPPLAEGLLCDPRLVRDLDARTTGLQLRAVDLLLSVAAWLAGASVADYRRSRGRVWYAPSEVAPVVERARYLALAEQIEDPTWCQVLTVARQLCAHWRATHGGQPHACEARIAWAVREVAQRQHPTRASRAA